MEVSMKSGVSFKTFLESISANLIGTPSQLGVSIVYRTDKPDEYFKGKAIWGVGKYFSLTLDDSKKINAGGTIKEYYLPDTLQLMEFDLTWRNDRERSNHDYQRIHQLIDNHPEGVDGFVVKSHSLQYGFSQLVIFPHAQNQVKEGNVVS